MVQAPSLKSKVVAAVISVVLVGLAAVAGSATTVTPTSGWVEVDPPPRAARVPARYVAISGPAFGATSGPTANLVPPTPTPTSVIELDPTTAEPVGRIPWAWIGIGLGLPMLMFSVWLLAAPGSKCGELRREWEARQRQAESMREAFAKAVTTVEERRAARAEVEAEIAGIEMVEGNGATGQASPKARLPAEGGTLDDQVLAAARERLQLAREAERAAEVSAEGARQQLGDAEARTEVAGRAYEQCIGKAMAGLAPAPGTSTTTGRPVSLPALDDGESD